MAVLLKGGVGANNGGSVALNFTHKAKMPRTCVCVLSASVDTVATLCLRPAELFAGDVWIRDNIVMVQICVCHGFCMGSSGHWFTFHRLRVSNYSGRHLVTPHMDALAALQSERVNC